MKRRALWGGLSFVLVVGVAALVLTGGGRPEVQREYEEYLGGLKEGEFPVPRECFEQAMEEGQLNIYDWAGWWPEEMYTNFEKEFGIKIVRDNFAAQDEQLTKFRLYPETEYDVAIPDDRTFMQMKRIKVLQEMNWDWLPNADKYLSDTFRHAAAFEPGCPYGLAVTTSFLGYGYNSKYVDPSDPRIGSFALLFEGKEYAGSISMSNDMFYVIGAALKYLGYSWNSDDEEELMEAKEVLLRQKPWVRYQSWAKRLVLEEEVVIGEMFAGDAALLKEELPQLEPVVPKEGSLIVFSILCIPIGSPHPAAAHLWMNYIYRPQVYATMTAVIKYPPTHITALELVPEEISETIRLGIPDKETMGKFEVTTPKAFTGKGLELRTAIWEELKG